jgi:hypothetical protein
VSLFLGFFFLFFSRVVFTPQKFKAMQIKHRLNIKLTFY